jgi:hypothetical protein
MQESVIARGFTQNAGSHKDPAFFFAPGIPQAANPDRP